MYDSDSNPAVLVLNNVCYDTGINMQQKHNEICKELQRIRDAEEVASNEDALKEPVTENKIEEGIKETNFYLVSLIVS